VVTLETQKGSAYGAALLAPAGAYSSVPEVCRAVIRETDSVAPVEADADFYARAHRVYQAFYLALKPLYGEIGELGWVCYSPALEGGVVKVFEVFLNGERLCVAGIDGDGVLIAYLSSARIKGSDDLDLDVGGLVSTTREHLKWARVGLNLGDEVRVRILESVSADEPEERKREEPERELERQRNYVREMAKKLGWTLTEGPNSGRSV
jgi:hypothetical protein